MLYAYHTRISLSLYQKILLIKTYRLCRKRKKIPKDSTWNGSNDCIRPRTHV